MTVHIDADTCVGSAMCVSITGGMLALDGDGKAAVIAAPAGEQVDEAIESCPVSAISRRPTDEGAGR